MGNIMSNRQHRQYTSVEINSTAANSDVLSMGKSAGGLVFIPTGATITSVTFQVSVAQQGGDFYDLVDSTGAAVTRTVAADQAFALPDELFAADFFRMVGDATEEEASVNFKD